jgi:hypothetical protein
MGRSCLTNYDIQQAVSAASTSENTDRILWIDVICINQDNLQKRGHQVRQMNKIYEEAEQVIIWLGLATE